MANINKNIIMQAGTAVANATNKAAGLSASTPEPGSIISAIQLVNGGRTIGPAALAHFTESVRNKLLSLLVSMEPIQDFNGYGHPWPGGGGKNKFDKSKARLYNNIARFIKYGVNAYADTTPNGDLTLDVGTYTLSISGDETEAPASITAYDSSGNTIAVIYNNKIFTFTTSSAGACYLAINFGNAVTWGNYNIQLEQSSTATPWEPYENICPISGRTGLNVYAGPTSAIGDAATYSMDWTSPAGTVYAGSADIVTGDIKAAPYYASYNGETLVGPWVSSMDVYDPEGTPTTGAQVVDLGGAMTEYHITGQDIITLVGDNYIWSDSGDVTITE